MAQRNRTNLNRKGRPVDLEHPIAPLTAEQEAKLTSIDLALTEPAFQETYPDLGEFCQKMYNLYIYFLDSRRPTTKRYTERPVFRRLDALFHGLVRDLQDELAIWPQPLSFGPGFPVSKVTLEKLQPVSFLMSQLVDTSDPSVQRRDATGKWVLDTIYIYR